MIVLNDLGSNPANPTGSFVEIFSRSGKLYYMDSSGTAVAVSDPVPSPTGTYTTVAKTADYTITGGECVSNTLFTNSGASGTVTFTLPSVGTVGNDVRFMVLAGQTLNVSVPVTGTNDIIDPQGKKRILAFSSTIGHTASLTYIGANTWVCNSSNFSYGSNYSEYERFIYNTGISDNTIRTGMNAYVTGLVDNNLWGKFYALYPIVGGTSATHKYNLINPLDTNAAFRLTFSGSITHNANGMTGDGISGYADTNFNDTTNSVDRNNFGIGLYCRTNDTQSTVDMGSVISFNYTSLTIRANSTTDGYGTYSAQAAGNYLINSQGLIYTQRISSTTDGLYRNGILVNSSGLSTTGTSHNQNYFLMCRNLTGSPTNYSSRNYSMFFISRFLTLDEQQKFYTLTQQLQTTLGRQV